MKKKILDIILLTLAAILVIIGTVFVSVNTYEYLTIAGIYLLGVGFSVALADGIMFLRKKLTKKR